MNVGIGLTLGGSKTMLLTTITLSGFETMLLTTTVVRPEQDRFLGVL